MPQDFFPNVELDVPKLRDLLGGLYVENDASERWDQALRIGRTALSFIDAESAETRDADAEMVLGLALVYLVRTKVVPTVRVRASVEAYFVSQGWTALRSRQLMHGLEHLPDKPNAIEEKLVADAEAWSRLGVHGFARTAAAAGATGTPLDVIVDTVHKNIHRRMFTRAAQARSMALRDELREMLTKLRKVFEDEAQ